MGQHWEGVKAALMRDSASGVVRQTLAVRAAGARGAAEVQLGIARHTTEPTNHLPGGCRALALPLLESGCLRRSGLNNEPLGLG